MFSQDKSGPSSLIYSGAAVQGRRAIGGDGSTRDADADADDSDEDDDVGARDDDEDDDSESSESFGDEKDLVYWLSQRSLVKVPPLMPPSEDGAGRNDPALLSFMRSTTDQWEEEKRVAREREKRLRSPSRQMTPPVPSAPAPSPASTNTLQPPQMLDEVAYGMTDSVSGVCNGRTHQELSGCASGQCGGDADGGGPLKRPRFSASFGAGGDCRGSSSGNRDDGGDAAAELPISSASIKPVGKAVRRTVSEPVQSSHFPELDDFWDDMDAGAVLSVFQQLDAVTASRSNSAGAVPAPSPAPGPVAVASAAAVAPPSSSPSCRPACPELDPSKDELIMHVLDIDEEYDGNFRMRLFGWDDMTLSMFMQTLDSTLRRWHSGQRSKGRVDDGVKRVVKWDVVQRRSIMGYEHEPHPFVRVAVSSPVAVAHCAQILQRNVRLLATPVGFDCSKGMDLFETNVNARTRFVNDMGIGGSNWIRLPPRSYVHRSFDNHGSQCQIEVDTSCNMVESLPLQGPFSGVASFVLASFDIECLNHGDSFPDASDPRDAVIMVSTTLLRQGEPEPFFKHIISSKPCLPIDGVTVVNVCTEAELLLTWQQFIRQADPDVLVGYNIFNFDLPFMMDRAALLGIQREFSRLGRIDSELSQMTESMVSSRAHGTSKTKRVSMSGRVQIDLYPLIQKEHKLPSYSLNNVSEHFLKDKKEDVPWRSIAPLFNGDDEGRTRLAVYCVKDAILPLKLMVKLSSLINLIEMARATGVPLNDLITRGQQHKVFSQLLRFTAEENYVVPIVPASCTPAAQRHTTKPSTSASSSSTATAHPSSLSSSASFFAVHSATSSRRADDGDGHEDEEGDDDNDDDDDDGDDDDDDSGSKKPQAHAGGYVGATVIEPIRGLYWGPVCTLDFAALYPSIIIAYNLSYETLLTGGKKQMRAMGIPPERVNVFLKGTSAEICFLKPADDAVESKGLLPRILIGLLDARKKAKRAMKDTQDANMKAILNGRQLALKISCNSIYGFCGAVKGYLPCIPIASTVTSIGRSLIDQTKACVESTYTLAKGHPGNAVVVYGDTDSVMINFNLPNEQSPEALGRAMELGNEAASVVTALFPRPICLEFEKVYRPYMLFSKKRYAGLLYSSTWERPDYLDVKGLQNVRRDSCALLRETYTACLDAVMKEADVQKAKFIAQQAISRLLSRQVSMHKLLLSRKLSKLEYKSQAPHVHLAHRLMKRDPNSAPKVGDRIPFVIVEGSKKSSVAERAEDPVFVLERNLSLDVRWYLNNQLRNPLVELFSMVMSDPDKLFEDSTRVVHTRFTPKSSLMSAFLRPSLRCLNCNCAVLDSPGHIPLCPECMPLRAEIIFMKETQVAGAQAQRDSLWQTCTDCAGSRQFAELCRARDCDNFYERAISDRELRRLQDVHHKLKFEE